MRALRANARADAIRYVRKRKICRRIAAALNGELSAHSAGKGLGATFTFTVPLLLPTAEEAAAVLAATAADAPVALQAAAAPPSVADASWLSILVAEDDAPSRMIMRKLLTRLRARVTCVEDGAAAVAAAAQTRFDLIFMDLHMPHIDGLAATAAILAEAAAQQQAPKIVALTASCSEDVKAKCAAAGMVAHLSKPVNTQRLEQLIRELCSSGAPAG
jgi:CheY-like chemotaxis protein